MNTSRLGLLIGLIACSFCAHSAPAQDELIESG